MDLRKTAFTTLIGLILVVCMVAGQQVRRVDDGALKNAAKNGEEWLTYGLTQGETRFSPLKQINTSNVGRLGLAWSLNIGPGGGGQEATPLFWNGTIFCFNDSGVAEIYTLSLHDALPIYAA